MRPHNFVSRLVGLQLFRFCIIGSIGFFSDAAVLLALIHGLGIAAVPARLVSFACALIVTFEFNRRWTFAGSGDNRYFALLAGYMGVQGLGFACNFIIYTALCFWLPPSTTSPIVALAIASVAALSINYLGSRTLVFGKR